jgi:predicted ferric reductase
MQTSHPAARWAGFAVLAVIVSAPVVVSSLSPLQTGRTITWVLGTAAGVLGLSLLVVQMILPTRWLYVMLGGSNLRWHRRLGLAVAALVIAHVVGLYLYSPDDIGDALILQAPTYSRLGVLSAWCMLLTVGLALARRRLPLLYDDWQILHSVLAVAVTGTAVGHVLLLEGTLDGLAEWLVCLAAVAAATAGIVYWHVLRPLERRKRIR